MRRLLAILALFCAFVGPAAAVDFPLLDGRVIDEAHLLDPWKKGALENKLANLEAQTSRQLMVVTLASARGMTVDAAVTGACEMAESQTPVLGVAVPYAVGNVVLTVLGPIIVAATFTG